MEPRLFPLLQGNRRQSPLRPRPLPHAHAVVSTAFSEAQRSLLENEAGVHERGRPHHERTRLLRESSAVQAEIRPHELHPGTASQPGHYARSRADRPRELFIKRGKGSYVVVFYEGQYFCQPSAERTIRQKNAIFDHPLFEPLRTVGIDTPAIRHLLKTFSHGVIKRWIQVTEAAMRENPRGFSGFRASPAAFLIDGVHNNRTPPDWFHAHEKRQEHRRWEQERTASDQAEQSLQLLYAQERAAALKAYLASDEGREKYDQTYRALLGFCRVTDPHRPEAAAREAALTRIERLDFKFPDFAVWTLRRGLGESAA